MATAKKPTAAKRPYNRRKKAAEPIESTMTDNTAEAAGENAEYQPPTPEELLQATDIIDLRQDPPQAKYLLAMQLEQAGYLFAHATNSQMTEHVGQILGASAFRLNHQNKLVTLVGEANIMASPAVVRVVQIEAQLDLQLSMPGPVSPDTIVANGHVYIKAV